MIYPSIGWPKPYPSQLFGPNEAKEEAREVKFLHMLPGKEAVERKTNPGKNPWMTDIISYKKKSV